MGRVVLWTLLVMWAVSSFVQADPRDQFAQETGLDRDLINLVKVDVNGTELTVVFVYITERTFSSKISAQLAATLRPYVGMNAFYVNPSIDDVVSSFPFDPLLLSARQGGASIVPPWEAWDEITPGFVTGRFEVNPSGPSQGSGSEGVVIFGDLLDPDLSFDLVYSGQPATFDIGTVQQAQGAIGSTSGSPTAAAPSHDPINVAPVETLDSLQDLLLHEEFSADALAAAFELAPPLVRTLVITPRGHELRLFLVRLEPSIRTGRLGEDLVASLDEVIGTGAVMVWAVSPTGAEFTPWNFYIRQGGTNFVFFSQASFVELTEGFLRVERVELNEVAAGVIRLPRSVNANEAFSVFYGTQGADFP